MQRLLFALGASAVLAVPAVAQARDTVLKLDAIAAMVGNTPITVYDVEQRLGDSLSMFMRRGAGMPNRTLQLAMVEAALNDIVDEEVLLLKAREAGIEVSDVELSIDVDNHMKQVQSQYRTQAEFRQALAQAGYGTPEEFRRMRTAFFRRGMILQKYVQRLRMEGKLPSVVVPEADVRAKYDQLKARGEPGLTKRAYAVGWRQMVVAPQASAAEKAKARAKAETLRAEIKAGGDFERIAKRESMDAATKDLGGDLGWRKRGDLPTELERLMFGPMAIKQGDVSPVVESPYGYHLLRIDRSNPPAEVKVRQILIIPKIDSSDVARARILADSLVGVLRRGGAFDTVARLYHDRAEDAPGLIPETFLDSLPTSYQTGLTGVKKDSIVTFPIDAVGYQKFVIAQVESTSEPGDYTYEEVKLRIRAQLQQIGQMRKYIDQTRKTVYVRLYPERAQEAARIFALAPGR
jgi:peptidyl-prolyl cis-trans isomerase SurA